MSPPTMVYDLVLVMFVLGVGIGVLWGRWTAERRDKTHIKR